MLKSEITNTSACLLSLTIAYFGALFEIAFLLLLGTTSLLLVSIQAAIICLKKSGS
jgi:hypothetical protein